MHQREDFMMSLSFQFKMSPVRTVGQMSKHFAKSLETDISIAGNKYLLFNPSSRQK